MDAAAGTSPALGRSVVNFQFTVNAVVPRWSRHVSFDLNHVVQHEAQLLQAVFVSGPVTNLRCVAQHCLMVEKACVTK